MEVLSLRGVCALFCTYMFQILSFNSRIWSKNWSFCASKYVCCNFLFFIFGVNDLIDSLCSYNIDQHDYSVRLKAARKFLNDGDKVVEIFLWLHLVAT